MDIAHLILFIIALIFLLNWMNEKTATKANDQRAKYWEKKYRDELRKIYPH